MNTRKFFYGIMACAILMGAAACTDDSADSSLYENGIDRSKVEKSNSIDRSKVQKNNTSIDRSKVQKNNNG